MILLVFILAALNYPATSQRGNSISEFTLCQNPKSGTSCDLSCRTKDVKKVIRFYKDGVAQEGCYLNSFNNVTCTSYIHRYTMMHDAAQNEIVLNITRLNLGDSGLWSCKYGKKESKNLTLTVYEFAYLTREVGNISDITYNSPQMFAPENAFLLKCCYPEPDISINPQCDREVNVYRQQSHDCQGRRAQSYIVVPNLENCTGRVLNITVHLANTQVATLVYENSYRMQNIFPTEKTNRSYNQHNENERLHHNIILTVTLTVTALAVVLISLGIHKYLNARKQHDSIDECGEATVEICPLTDSHLQSNPGCKKNYY